MSCSTVERGLSICLDVFFAEYFRFFLFFFDLGSKKGRFLVFTTRFFKIPVFYVVRGLING